MANPDRLRFPSRRQFLSFGAKTVATVATGGSLVACTSAPATPRLTANELTQAAGAKGVAPRPTEIPQEKPAKPLGTLRSEILSKEITAQGIGNDAQEIQLWEREGYQFVPTKPEINDSAVKEAERRFDHTLALMARSKNKYFSEAAKVFNELKKSDDIDKKVVSLIRGDEAIGMETNFVVKNNNVHAIISISANMILTRSNALMLAIQLTHEIEHIKNMRNRVEDAKKVFPIDTPADFFLNLERFEKADTKKHVTEEARGYAAGTTALIETFRLGYRGAMSEGLMRDMETFIRYGKSADDPRWKNYIATNYMGLPPG